MQATNSGQGKTRLQEGITNNDKVQRVAMSDGFADDSVTAKTARRAVAVVPYSVILNKKIYPAADGTVNLTTGQLRKIFDGKQKNWNDIDPRFANLPIRIVARGQSGSRNAFERYVLGNGVQQASQGQRTSTNCVDQDDVDDVDKTKAFLCEEFYRGRGQPGRSARRRDRLRGRSGCHAGEREPAHRRSMGAPPRFKDNHRRLPCLDG